MSYTPNLNLYLTPDSDSTTTFKDWRLGINGESGSNMTKIDAAYGDIDDELKLKANIDGAYEEMTVGNAEQIISSVRDVDKVPYNFRTSGGSADIGNRSIDTIIGGTVVWNQLVDTTDTSVTVPSGDKYISRIGGTWSAGVSDGIEMTVDGAGGDKVFDITKMYGSAIADYYYSLGSAYFIDWFRDLYPSNVYSYNAGTLMSVSVQSHDMVGFNQWDELWEKGRINANTGNNDNTQKDTVRSTGYIPVFPNTVYYTTVGVARYYYDADKKFLGSTYNASSSGAAAFTTPATARYMRFRTAPAYGTTYKNDICINISWSGYRNGEYEAYDKKSYPLDTSLVLCGIPKLGSNNKIYYDGDIYSSDGTVTRKYQTRAYQAGDESLANAVTDGTNTVVALTTATTESATPFQSPQVVNDFGTEEYVDYAHSQPTRDVSIPVGHTTEYPLNLRDKLQHLPDKAAADGKYIIGQSNFNMHLVPFNDTSSFNVGLASGELAYFQDGADGTPLKSANAQIVVTQEGSGTPSPTNVRPVVGVSSAKVICARKNLFDGVAPNGYILSSSGDVGSSSSFRYSQNYIPVVSGMSYTISGASYSGEHGGAFYDKDKSYISGFSGSNPSYTITAPSSAAFVRFTMGSSARPTAQIEYGTSATAYSAGATPVVADVDWSDEIGPVYGGTVDLSTGIMTITWGSTDLGSETWSRSAADNPFFYRALSTYANSTKTDVLCERYETKVIGQTSTGDYQISTDNNGSQIRVRDNRYTTASSFKTAVSGVYAYYALGTPQIVKFSTDELRTFLGDNTVVTNLGNISVEYCSHPLEPTSEGSYVLKCVVTSSGRYFAWDQE